MALVFLFHGFNFCYGIFFHFYCCFVFELLSCLFLIAGPQFCVSILSLSLSLSLSPFLDENCVVGWSLRGSLRLL